MSTHVLKIGDQEYALKWSLRARYRLQSLIGGASLSDLVNPDRAIKALGDVAWASLPPDAPFASPTDLIVALDPLPDATDRLDTAVAAALQLAADSPTKKA